MEYTGRSITAERNFNARSFDEFAVDFPERVSDGFDGEEDFSIDGEERVRWGKKKFPIRAAASVADRGKIREC